jgi:hypothetical protein
MGYFCLLWDKSRGESQAYIEVRRDAGASSEAFLHCLNDRRQRRPAIMANLDPELLRLEEVLRRARVRLALVIEKVGDPAAVKAAEDLCAEAAAAVAAHKA